MITPVSIQQIAAPQTDRKELFYRHFQQECTELQEQIVKLEDYSLVGGEKQDAIDHVLAGISRLANEVQDSSEFIPAYDQRIYSQVSLIKRHC
jgi:flagellar biosynthesis chaperone FliJ